MCKTEIKHLRVPFSNASLCLPRAAFAMSTWKVEIKYEFFKEFHLKRSRKWCEERLESSGTTMKLSLGNRIWSCFGHLVSIGMSSYRLFPTRFTSKETVLGPEVKVSPSEGSAICIFRIKVNRVKLISGRLHDEPIDWKAICESSLLTRR